jgi:small lipoprotein (TIGR04454 family)
MTMKLRMLTVTVLASALVASCGSKPLTEFECQALANKEIDFAVSKAPPEEAEDLRAFLEKNMDDNNQQCMKGRTYHRSDYRCMVEANDLPSIGKCIAGVNKRLGH